MLIPHCARQDLRLLLSRIEGVQIKNHCQLSTEPCNENIKIDQSLWWSGRNDDYNCK